MTRLVFRVLVGRTVDGGAAWEIALEEPPVLGRRAEAFPCTGSEPEFAAITGGTSVATGAVRSAGRVLYDAVATNAQLAQFLASAMQVQQPQRFPVYVEFTTPGAEILPWEALCSPDGDFLGLDERWGVGRIVDSLSPLEPVWQLAPPVRVAAVLSSLGVPADSEWTALRDACSSVPGLPVQLLVLVSETALHEKITAEAAPGVEVRFVPDDLGELQQVVRAFRPHVLHLFCHGSSTGTKPHLQIAVKSDWLAGTTSSLLVEAREVRDFTNRTDSLPWLAVLNCCESASAQGPENTQSVALNLVHEGGIPAVVGMREPVRSDDATLFTDEFYGRLLRDLARRAPGGDAVGLPPDWALLAVQARNRLARKHHGLLSEVVQSTREWTMPVVYSRPTSAVPPPPGPTAPTVPAAPAAPAAPPDRSVGSAAPEPSARALRLEVEALTGLLDRLAAGADPALVTEIQQRIADLRARLAES